MSFALDYRRKMQDKAHAARQENAAQEKAHAGFVVMPAGDDADTGGNRRRALAMLSLAGLILSFFNSGALVQYAGGLADSSIGMRIIVATESWHDLMEKNHLTLVVEEIRGVVSHARRSDWPDLASGLGFGPARPGLDKPGGIKPVNQPIDENAPGESEPAIEATEPAIPVMRAAVQ